MSTGAFAEILKGDKAVEVLMKGKVVSEHWPQQYITTHISRVIYKGRYWACRSFDVDEIFEVRCISAD